MSRPFCVSLHSLRMIYTEQISHLPVIAYGYDAE